ncbi:MAG: hypothetical protein V3S01_07075 [Dehalococcoidia bacterium]
MKLTIQRDTHRARDDVLPWGTIVLLNFPQGWTAYLLSQVAARRFLLIGLETGNRLNINHMATRTRGALDDHCRAAGHEYQILGPLEVEIK